MPPALNRPALVSDLSVQEHGSKLLVHFTVPTRTTENLAIKKKPDIELRMGPAPPGPWDQAVWEQNSQRVPEADIHIDRSVASVALPVEKLYNQTLVFRVRVRGPHGRDVGWSSGDFVTVVPALPIPEGLTPKDAPDAIRLDWHATAPQFRVFRKLPDDKDWTLLVTSPTPFYLDQTIDYGKTYQYEVQSVEMTGPKFAESEISSPVTFTPTDTFPPATPVGLTGLPGARTIELVWERNAEKDLSSYVVYRDGKKISEGQSAPAFSDKDVKPGVRYQYQVSAIDSAGNESPKSAAIDVVIP